jgi:hypothetical protein
MRIHSKNHYSTLNKLNNLGNVLAIVIDSIGDVGSLQHRTCADGASGFNKNKKPCNIYRKHFIAYQDCLSIFANNKLPIRNVALTLGIRHLNFRRDTAQWEYKQPLSLFEEIWSAKLSNATRMGI